jgi:dimethylargininase
MFTTAITRTPPENFAQGITTSTLGKPDYSLVLQQHQPYIHTLQSLGLNVVNLEPLPGFPDSYFVEDVAVVIPEVAIITNPGAPARNGEVAYIDSTLKNYRKIERIQSPGTMDGGDVLLVEKRFFIGISERTNPAGIDQFAKIVAKFGYETVPVPVAKGLHFKSSVNAAGNILLVCEDFAKREEIKDYQKILIPPGEEYAANTLWVNGTLITPAGYPATRKLLDALGMPVIELDVSEVCKMDGGLTCMSLRF